MAMVDQLPRRAAQSLYARILHRLGRWPWRRRQVLSKRLARDVGLDPEQHPFERIPLPSEVWSHPRL